MAIPAMAEKPSWRVHERFLMARGGGGFFGNPDPSLSNRLRNISSGHRQRPSRLVGIVTAFASEHRGVGRNLMQMTRFDCELSPRRAIDAPHGGQAWQSNVDSDVQNISSDN